MASACAWNRATCRAPRTVFNLDPAAQARSFAAQGFRVSATSVDSRRAPFAGKPMNALAVEAMLKAVTMPVQLGGRGNSRSQDRGSLARQGHRAGHHRQLRRVRDPELVKTAAKKISRPASRSGLDARDGKVAGRGLGRDLAGDCLGKSRQRFEDAGVAAIIFTDIGA